MNNDRQIPQAPDIEQKVLGGMILYSECFEIAAQIISSEMFYVQKNILIFRAIESLVKNKKQIDLVTVCEELKNLGTINDVGYSFVASLTTDGTIASPSNIGEHCLYIQEYFMKRETIKHATSLIEQSFDPTYDVFDLASNVRNLDSMFSDQMTGSNQFNHISKLIDTERKRYDLKYESNEKGLPLGIDTGFKQLNAISYGWQKGNLIIIGARPAVGKTALMLAFSIAAAKSGVPVYIPTLEMTPDELVERILISESGVNSEKYKSASLTDAEIVITDDHRNKIKKMGIYIDDTPAISTTKLKALCRKFCKEHPNGIVMIDYLQKMTVENSRNKNREVVINEISQELKNIARENKIPVVALSQLSRGLESRPDKRPMLSDLRESGAIEQEADVVLFIHRPEYYDGFDSPGIAELIIAKYRNGKTGTLNVNFIGELIKFSDPHQIYVPNQNFYEVEKSIIT